MLKTTKEDEAFFAELNVPIKAAWLAIHATVKAASTPIYGFSFGVPDARPVLTKYGLDAKFDFYVDLSGGVATTKWLYGGFDLKPKTHWIQQDNHGSFSNLEVFREAMKQDTHEPDMKQIEIDRGCKHFKLDHLLMPRMCRRLLERKVTFKKAVGTI